MNKITLCALFALVTLGASVLAVAEPIPAPVQVASGYRNDGSGVWPDATPAILDGAKPKTLWTTPLPGGGDSAPLLVGDMVVITTEPDQVLAFDAATGKERWKATCDVFSTYGDTGAALKDAFFAAHAINTDYNVFKADPIVVAAKEKMKTAKCEVYIALPVERPSYATSSPCSDGTNIIVKFRTGIVACYDLKGQETWKQRMAGAITYSSPIFVAGKGIVPTARGHVALDPATGKVLWENAKISEGAWGTVQTIRLGDRLVGISGGGQIFDPANGKVLAETAVFGQHATLACWHDIVIVPEGHFYNRDKNPQVRAFRLTPSDDGGISAKEIWHMPGNFNNCQPTICLDGYFVIETGSLKGMKNGNTIQEFKALDGTIGPEPFLRSLGGAPHVANAGLSVAGNTCIGLGADGTILIANMVNGSLKETSKAKLPVDIYRAAPAFAGKRMYVHGHTQLLCLGE